MRMVINKGIFSVLGSLIASVLVIPLGMKVIDLFKHKNDFEPLSAAYCKNIVEIPVHMSNLDQGSEKQDYGNYIKREYTVKYSAVGRKDASEYVSENYKIDKDSLSSKYFKIILIVRQFNMTAHRVFLKIEKQDSLILTVNREEYEDPNNGTKDRPYLAFGVRGAEKPITWLERGTDKDLIIDITPEQYRYNAEMYWTYVATDEEFDKRFKKVDSK